MSLIDKILEIRQGIQPNEKVSDNSANESSSELLKKAKILSYRLEDWARIISSLEKKLDKNQHTKLNLDELL